MNRLEDDYQDQIVVLRLNAFGDGEAAFKAGGFPGHPAMVILQPDGRESWRALGVQPYEDVKAAIDKVL